jgi:uncharacterized protein YfaS (alpha-2-macroglobulin family)
MKNYRSLLALCIFLAAPLLAACRPKEESEAPPLLPSPENSLAPTPTIAPTTTSPPWSHLLEVTSAGPLKLDDFPSHDPFTLHFNQPMDIGSVPLPLLISPFVEGQLFWNESGTHLTYTPDSGFKPGERYTIVLDSGLTSSSGLAFSESPHWLIQVSSAPQVMSRFPGAQHIMDRRPEIRLTFDRTMDPENGPAVTVAPALPLRAIWDDNSLLIQLDEPMNPGTLYQFTLSREVADDRGNSLAGEYHWNYRAPKLVASTVTPGETNRAAPIVINFNYAMDEDSVRKAIQFKPAIVGDLSLSEDKKSVTFTPATPLLPSAGYSLTFDQPLLDANGDLLPSFEGLQFITPPPVLHHSPRGENVLTSSTIEVTFDRLADENATAAAFQIMPEIAGDISWRGTTLIFSPHQGHFAENSGYTVMVDEGALDQHGQPLLNEPYTWQFTTGRLRDVADFGWGPNAQLLDAGGRRAVQFHAYQVGTGSLTFELYRLNLAQFLDRYASGFRGVAGWDDDRPISTEDTRLVTRWTLDSVELPLSNNRIGETFIPEDVAPGLYILNLTAGHVNDQLILLISHNTIMVKQAEGQLLVWVTEINGQPVPGAEVEIYARDGELIAHGRASDQGTFQSEIAGDPQPLIVVAHAGDDISASGLSNEWRSNRNGWWSWWQPSPSSRSFAAYIYTDRPIYRPGQTVYYKAILRRDEDALLSILPFDTPVTVRIRDSRDNVVQTFERTTSHFGTIDGEFQLGEGVMLGEYAVELVLDGESLRQLFKVEDYRKPDIQVTVNTATDRFIEGEMVEVTVDASYFFGQPVPDADIVVNLFELGPKNWWEDSSEADATWFQSFEPARNGRSGANGRYTFSFPAKAGTRSWQQNWRSNLTRATWAIEATVDDGSHQTVSGFAVIDVYNSDVKLQLETGGYFHEPGTPFSVETEAVDLFDQPLASQNLLLTVRRWDRAGSGYDLVLQSIPLTSDSDGRAVTQLLISEAGFYQIRLAGFDRLGHPIEYNSYVYAFSGSFGRWYGGGETLSISADREQYAPGDQAQLIIETEISGPGLLTFERGSTRRQQLIQLTAPVTMVDVQIQPDDAPNIHVTINAWQEEDTRLTPETWSSLSDSRLHTASINLSVPVTDKSLSITITPDKEIYAPREEATVTVLVTNQAGHPVSAEVSLAMVDESIFALSKELSGNIFDAFYSERDNLVRTYDALALIRYLGGGGGGGGGVLMGNPRADFPDTAQWFPVLHTDYKGEATVTFTLPDSLTSWRLTAKGTTTDTQVGQAKRNILTQQEFVVRPILPRTLTAGDTVNLSAIVHNYSDATQRVELRLLTGDSLLTPHDAPLQSRTVAPGGTRLVGWQLSAAGAGEAQITVQLEVGGIVRDAVQLPLPIRPLAIPDVTSQVGQFSGELATTVDVPAGALPMSSLRLELGRSIAGTLLEGLEYLTGFPYGCVEQTMSRALPNAVVGRAFAQLGVGNPTIQADLPAKVNAGLQRLYGYQHNDGGWGWWYDDSSHDYQTAWVIFGLAMMADAGYEVDQGVIERGVAWLNDHLDAMDIRTRAYALYSMAAAGSPNLAESTSLLDRLDELDTFSLSGLALALHEAGAAAEAASIVDLLAATAIFAEGDKVHWSGVDYDGAYYRKTMASATRSTALALSAFTQIRPGHELEPGIVRWLMGQRRQQGWGTTNETSYAVLGLTDHLLTTSFSDAAEAVDYTIWLNGKAVATGALQRGEPAMSLEIPAAQLENGINQLRVSQSGGHRLYYGIHNRVLLAQEKIESAGVIDLQRTYLDPQSGEPVETAEAGQLVRVRLTVVTSEDASYVLVEDHLPGGLEALNEGLNTSSRQGEAYQEPEYRWRDHGYNYKEVRGDRVTFFITELEGGTHTYNYFARATHAGSFVAMPVEAHAMYDLATWGRSASARLTISR